jgi:hypothetical protein
MTTQTKPAPNMLVYLFAEQFSSPVKGLSALAGGMVAPRTGEKVNLQQLVTNLYVAAVMELVQLKAARLETIEVKKFLGKENVLALILEQTTAPDLSFLAAQMVKQIEAAKKPADCRIREIVIRLVGGRGSTQYPWLMAVAPVITAAERDGYVRRPENKPGIMKAMFNPLEAKTQVEAAIDVVAPLETGIEALKEQLLRFEQSIGPLAGTLRKEIEKGVDDCKDSSD